MKLVVAAIFATMNRGPTAVHCVQALAAQERPPDKVIVADNKSDDDTVTALLALPNLPFPLEIIEMQENSGNAGGIAAAMDRAFKREIDAVWILDDDSFPRPSALKALLLDYSAEAVHHPLQLNPKTGRFTWPTVTFRQNGSHMTAWTKEQLGASGLIETKGAWTGALVSKIIYDKVGSVNSDLFIRGEDEEYPWRIAKYGYRFYQQPEAILDHVGPVNMVKWNFWGKNLYLERGLSGWKLYYKVRNMVWLKHLQVGLPAALIMWQAYLIGMLRLNGLKTTPVVIRAGWDGLRGRLGKIDHSRF